MVNKATYLHHYCREIPSQIPVQETININQTGENTNQLIWFGLRVDFNAIQI
jgi:hypothetical protein